MRMPYHIVISLVISGIVYLLLRSIAGALACFIAGVFIDLDHLFDYFLNIGPPVRVKHFFWTFKYDVLNNIIVFFHAWEWVLIMFVILWLIDWNPVAVGLFFGVCSHLLLDEIFNDHQPLAYFLTYRVFHRFSARHFYSKHEYEKRLKNTKKTGVTEYDRTENNRNT